MKQKIVEALKQEYKNLGLADEVFERVASSVETFITDEAQIPNFVKGAEGLLKTYQSTGDKARGEAAAEKKRADSLQAELDKLKADDGKVKPQTLDAETMSKAIAEAVATAIKPLQEKIDAYDGAANIEKAVNGAKDSFFANDYVKKYKDEASDAWERAIEVNAAGGNKMTADELSAKAMGYFNTAVKRIGVDTAQPFKSDHTDTATVDWSSEKERLQNSGRLPKESK